MDEFSERRYNTLAKGFVEIYGTNKLLAAKMLQEENIPAERLPIMRDKITQEFLRQGYTFPEGAVDGA